MDVGTLMCILMFIVMAALVVVTIATLRFDMYIKEKRLIRASKLVSIYYRNLKQ